MAVLTSIEDVQPFINTETLEVDIESLKKDELLLIAEYGGLDVSRADRKQVIKSVVMKYLCLEADSIDEDKPVPVRKDEDPKPVQSRRGSRGSRSSLVEGDNVDDDDEVSETGKDRYEITKLQLQIKLKQLENEAKEKDREDREKERKHEERQREHKERQREHQERQREHELKLAQLKFGGRNKGSDESFDLIHNIKLVPKFSEREVSKFFASFEKVAKQMKWPVENWTIMLQVVLVGKAQAAYSALSVEDSSNYELVKDVILKAYALVPEAYRQKFRELKKASDETYSEFARCKERLFEDWCNSRKVGNMQDMRELILLEEFKNCVPKDLKAHLEETQVETLKVAARTSDEYSLTHKKVYEGETRVEAGKSNMSLPRHFKPSSPRRHFKSPSPNSYNFYRRSNLPPREIVCYGCGMKGHVMARCYKLKGNPPSKKTMLVGADKGIKLRKAREIKDRGVIEGFQVLMYPMVQ
ncbi:uncharacterized protein [Macrobrachium rosenbergii]|uniref:uncharacterized protein n=1 Tax=Macrobrachium rosenbergii TaxID=79674 RepID=UPI0034D7B600